MIASAPRLYNLPQPKFSGQAFFPKPLASNLVPPISPILDHMHQPWSLEHYAVPRDPIIIGSVEDIKTFGMTGAPAIQELPIKMPGTDFRVPQELAQFESAIQKIIDFEIAVNPHLDDYFAYVRVDQRPVYTGRSQRVPGFHFDGVQGLNRMYDIKLPPHHEYLVSDNDDVGTTFLRQGFDFSDWPESLFNLHELAQKEADVTNANQGLAGVIYLIDAYLAHLSTPASRDDARTLFTIGFAPREAIYDRLGNTLNPLFYDQPNYPWRLVSRPIPKWLICEKNASSEMRENALRRRQASRLLELVQGSRDKQLEIALNDLERIRTLKQAKIIPAREQLSWTARRKDGTSGNPACDLILSGGEDFQSVLLEFQDQVFFHSRCIFAEIPIFFAEATTERLQFLVDRGILVDNQRVKNYISRFSKVGHFKILREDVRDPKAFEKEFNLSTGKISSLDAKSIVMHSMYGFWSELMSEIKTRYAPMLVPEQIKYLQDRQALGIANLLIVFRLLDRFSNSTTTDIFFDYLDAAASLSGSDYPFAQLYLRHKPDLNKTLLNWTVLKTAIRIFNKEDQYEDLLKEGSILHSNCCDS